MAWNKAWFAVTALVWLASACTTTTNGVEKPKLDPMRSAEAHTNLATAYYGIKQYQIAIDEANTALGYVPNFARAYEVLGLVYMALPVPAQAETNFRKALSIDSADPDINHNFGIFLCQNGHVEESLDYFKLAYSNALYPHPEKSLDQAGLCLLKLKRAGEARTLFEISLTKTAQDALALYELADLSYKNSDLTTAHNYLQRLSNIPDSDTADSLMLGWRLERALGNDAAAKVYAAKLKTAFPNSDQAKQLND